MLVTFCAIAVDATTPPDTLVVDGGSDLSLGAVDGGSSAHPFLLHHRRWGSAGSPVLLLHGFAESSVSWTPTAELLARHHLVDALDLPGWGYTSRTGRYDLATQVDVVCRFITAMHLDHPVLVGHSMGAAVAGEVARTHPGLVGGVVFADGDALPIPGGHRQARPLGWLLRSPVGLGAYRAITRNRRAWQPLMHDQCGSVCRALTPSLEQAWMRPFGQRDAERALPAMAAAGVLSMTPQQISAIGVPRGIIWGAGDATSGGSRSQAEENLRNPPEVVLPDAGHLTQVADPRGFAAALDAIEHSWRQNAIHR